MPQTNSTERRQTAALVVRLLSHYWTADDHEQTRQAQIEDWLDDLVEFGPVIVADACAAWRRGYRTRPTPADIRKLAFEDQRERQEWDRVQVKRLDGPPTDLDAWARSLGWASYLERQDAILAQKQRELAGDWNHPERSRERTAPAADFRSLAAALGVTATPQEDADARKG